MLKESISVHRDVIAFAMTAGSRYRESGINNTPIAAPQGLGRSYIPLPYRAGPPYHNIREICGFKTLLPT